eukprot:2914047-Prymnesium_polylepis.1
MLRPLQLRSFDTACIGHPPPPPSFYGGRMSDHGCMCGLRCTSWRTCMPRSRTPLCAVIAPVQRITPERMRVMHGACACICMSCIMQ